MHRRSIPPALTFLTLVLWLASTGHGELNEQSPNNPPALEQTPVTSPTAAPPSTVQTKEKAARIWANEPAIVRLARDKFGAELTDTDAKFFAAVAANEWADLRASSETTFNAEEPSSWSASAILKADRLTWLCTDPAAIKLVPSHGIWLRGANINGKVDLYRCDLPFSLTFYDCLFNDGINIAHAKLQELDIRNSCSAAIEGRAAQVAENVYLLTTCVFGGLDFIDANIGGDFDFSGGLAFHGLKAEDISKQGIALNFHDAKVAGDIKLGEKFRAIGQVRLIGTQIGRSLTCGEGKFRGNGLVAIDARRTTIGSNAVFTTGFNAEGGVEMRRSRIGGDLDCDGGRFIGKDGDGLSADLVNVGGQLRLGNGFHAEGEVRLINAVVEGDVDCDNGHFLNPTGDALSLDGAVIGRSLRIGADNASETDETKDLPTGFLARGTVRLWGTQVNQDILAVGAIFEAPTSAAILASNMKVASRVELTGVNAKGTVNLFSADIAHELDLRGSTFDGREAPNKIAIWANSMQVHGHVYCNQYSDATQTYKLRVYGLTSLQFATISMHWDLQGAELLNPGGDALDASDCRVGGYVNIDTVAIDGRASFSRAKIDGMWILNNAVEPEKTQLDMRFGHIWVIKDERLSDWPPAGQLQLEGLVYDHFDDDSPLDVHDRLAWLRRQYAPLKSSAKKVAAVEMNKSLAPHGFAGDALGARVARPQSPDRYAAADRYGVQPAQFEASAPAPDMGAPSLAPPITSPEKPSAPNPITPPAENLDGTEGSFISAVPAPAMTPGQAIDQADAAPTATAAPTQKATANSVAEDGEEENPKPPAATDPTGRRYVTQPYTQLATVYRAIGQDQQANTVLVARAERLGELAPRFSAQGLWYRYLGRLIGYGYEPFRAVKIGVAIVLFGAMVFAIGARRHLMAETKLAEQVLSNDNQGGGLVSPTYPRFNALVYSLDVFLPFVELNQVCYWIPGEKPSKPRKSRNCLMHVGPYSLKWSTVLHSYLWFQTLAGWTLCTLLAAALTGFVES